MEGWCQDILGPGLSLLQWWHTHTHMHTCTCTHAHTCTCAHTHARKSCHLLGLSTQVALSDDEQRAYTVSKDGTILMWDLQTMRKTRLFRPGECAGMAQGVVWGAREGWGTGATGLCRPYVQSKHAWARQVQRLAQSVGGGVGAVGAAD